MEDSPLVALGETFRLTMNGKWWLDHDSGKWETEVRQHLMKLTRVSHETYQR
jgi:hypothetical protein